MLPRSRFKRIVKEMQKTMPTPEHGKCKIRIMQMLSQTKKDEYLKHRPMVIEGLKWLREKNFPKVSIFDYKERRRIIFIIKLKSYTPDWKMALVFYAPLGRVLCQLDITATQIEAPKCFRMGEFA